MFVSVRLLNGFERLLIYQVPEHLQKHNLKGSIVHVPLKKEVYTAFVEDYVKPSTKFVIRPVIDIASWPSDQQHQAFIERIAYIYQLNKHTLMQRLEYYAQQKIAAPQFEYTPGLSKQVLTPSQQHIVTSLRPFVAQSVFCAALIHGVTGSGKTEVYKALIIECLNKKCTTLLLLPEVSLAEEFKRRLTAELNGCIIISLHSASSAADKRAAWQALVHTSPIVLIGVHVPVLMPIANLGLIIVDEEHDIGYQEKKHPKINSKYAALLRAQMYNIPCILGSATPCMESLYQVKQKRYAFFQLKERFKGSFPVLKSISLLAKTPKKREYFWVSNELLEALKNCLAQQKQAIIFINRRGYSFFVQCKSCSAIVHCHQCSVSLTLHQDDTLRCHYCDYKRPRPLMCDKCNADKLLSKGLGTQYIATLLKKLLPQACIERADKDTTTNKKHWQQTIHDFTQGKIDILVGTQTLTKGYHFPNVTLVGIIWADIALHFPWYNAAEVALQQLIQVAGRAGREQSTSTVIVQLIEEHPIMQYLNEHNYLRFYAPELVHRAAALYPPHTHLAELELRNSDSDVLNKESQQCFEHLVLNAQSSLKILGPVKPLVYKIKKFYSKKIYIKAPSLEDALHLFTTLDKNNYKSDIYWLPYAV